MGNHYWLVVRIVFEYKSIQIKWFGTHSEYDKVDVKTLKYKHQ
ncbi:type II toxin-antitoxin system HigB family toxin [Dyadobacter arcticus]|uniref:mRNA-degrading endonuclease HigB of HigAB toxin-antitoxin module n=1 Tax=Dyadobacter arcticus TaxID=1078754 RepID=A0ABX0UJ05_9BACT|nr:type II toxin-antitoxin system HigB family toxin [Dyadobacter arcticus]NIJ52792.1 mRNA-degrading endonuclease HigB of HigAB toxin-antitoxin module [Dyadobacter arcticus]